MSLFAIYAPVSSDVSAAVADAVEGAIAATQTNAWATDMAALRLAQELAEALDAPLNDVWFSLCNVPLTMAGLLDSPQGWSALAVVVAFGLGLPTSAYEPRVQ